MIRRHRGLQHNQHRNWMQQQLIVDVFVMWWTYQRIIRRDYSFIIFIDMVPLRCKDGRYDKIQYGDSINYMLPILPFWEKENKKDIIHRFFFPLLLLLLSIVLSLCTHARTYIQQHRAWSDWYKLVMWIHRVHHNTNWQDRVLHEWRILFYGNGRY